MGRSYFHLHLVSDSTGETLIAASRAASAQYQGVASIEHVYPLVRTPAQLDRVITEIENAPGIVLFTLVELRAIQASRRELRGIWVTMPLCLGADLDIIQVISWSKFDAARGGATYAQLRLL